MKEKLDEAFKFTRSDVEIRVEIQHLTVDMIIDSQRSVQPTTRAACFLQHIERLATRAVFFVAITCCLVIGFDSTGICTERRGSGEKAIEATYETIESKVLLALCASEGSDFGTAADLHHLWEVERVFARVRNSRPQQFLVAEIPSDPRLTWKADPSPPVFLHLT